MTEDPRPLAMQRRSVPTALGDAVRTALEKLPADFDATSNVWALPLRADGMLASDDSPVRCTAPGSALGEAASPNGPHAMSGGGIGISTVTAQSGHSNLCAVSIGGGPGGPLTFGTADIFRSVRSSARRATDRYPRAPPECSAS